VPGRLAQGGTSKALVSLVDVYRTLAELLIFDVDSPPFPATTAED
jgi:hypothetical protein